MKNISSNVFNGMKFYYATREFLIILQTYTIV